LASQPLFDFSQKIGEFRHPILRITLTYELLFEPMVFIAQTLLCFVIGKVRFPTIMEGSAVKLRQNINFVNRFLPSFQMCFEIISSGVQATCNQCNLRSLREPVSSECTTFTNSVKYFLTATLKEALVLRLPGMPELIVPSVK